MKCIQLLIIFLICGLAAQCQSFKDKLYGSGSKEWHEYNSKEVLGSECLTTLVIIFTSDSAYQKQCINKIMVSKRFAWSLRKDSKSHWVLDFRNKTEFKSYRINFGKSKEKDALMLRDYSENPQQATQVYKFRQIK